MRFQPSLSDLLLNRHTHVFVGCFLLAPLGNLHLPDETVVVVRAMLHGLDKEPQHRQLTGQLLEIIVNRHIVGIDEALHRA